VDPDSLGCDLRPRLAFPVELSSSFRKTEFELSCRKKAHNLEEFTQIARVHNIALMFSMSHIRSVWNDQHLTLDRFGSSRDTASPKGDKDTQDHWLGFAGLDILLLLVFGMCKDTSESRPSPMESRSNTTSTLRYLKEDQHLRVSDWPCTVGKALLYCTS
jgi:hypothetical protein